MYLTTEIEINIYERTSKSGMVHTYKRKRTLALFRCDNCEREFKRDLKHINKKRLSNNYFHCCSECDAKIVAQRKGVERKKIWDMPASIDWPVGKY